MAVVGLDLSEPPGVVWDYIETIGVSYRISVDRGVSATEISPNEPLIARLGIVGLPTTFFIDAEGIIRTRYLGELTRLPQLGAEIADFGGFSLDK